MSASRIVNYYDRVPLTQKADSFVIRALVRNASEDFKDVATFCTEAETGDYVFLPGRGSGLVVRRGKDHDILVGGTSTEISRYIPIDKPSGKYSSGILIDLLHKFDTELKVELPNLRQTEFVFDSGSSW